MDVSDKVSSARLLASSTRESCAWLSAPPISSLGLRMEDHVIRSAVALRLGAPFTEPHCCVHCGSPVDQLGTHGLHCKFSKGRFLRHSTINDIIKRTLDSINVPSRLEPSGIFRADGKRPDGMSLIPWHSGKSLVWDATCPDTVAPSHLNSSSVEAGKVAKEAEDLKTAKYSHLTANYHFVPVAIETLGAFGPSARSFFKELAGRLRDITWDPATYFNLCQRISVCIQRSNSISMLGSLPI